MKIAVINFSGNVGKTLVSKYLLLPRINAKHFSIETINYNENNDKSVRYKGKDYLNLQEELLNNENAIFDIGASNIDDFMSIMKTHAGFESEFDYFIVPVVCDKKQQIDTINTIESLFSLGVSSNRIKLIFNRVELNDSNRDELMRNFGLVVAYYDASKKFTLSYDNVVFNNDAFQLLHELGIDIDEALNDEKDYRQLYKQAENSNDKSYFMNRIIAKRLSVTAKKNLDELFNNLFSSTNHA